MCPEPNEVYGDDPELGRWLRERLPRHPAPPQLRAAVARTLNPEVRRPRWGFAWLGPSVAALATAMVLVMWMATGLPTTRSADPIQQISRAVVTEHARTLSWAQHAPDLVPATLSRVMEESGVILNWVFTGDEEIRLVSAQPTYVEGHRGMSLGYMDRDGHAVTYVIVPSGGVTLPEEGRVQIERWRPLIRRENGFSLILWKDKGMLCAMTAALVSESDLARLKEYFVKVRSRTELAPVF